MANWYPKIVEMSTTQASESDFKFALERASKIIYTLFCRFEALTNSPKAPLLPKHEGSIK